MKIFKLKKCGRFLKMAGKQVVVWLTSISLLGLPACGTNFDEPKTVQKEKDYNYYFKVIVPEEIERSMTAGKNDRIVANIEAIGRIVDKQSDSMYRNIEDITMNSASVAATVFVSKELRDTVDDLSDDGVGIMFSFNELLFDHSDHVEGRNVIGGPQGKARIFVYDGESSPRDSNAWNTAAFFVQAVTTERRSATDKETLEQMTFSKNRAIIDDFHVNLVEQISANPSVTLESGEQPGFVVLSTGSSQMTVELGGGIAELMAMRTSSGDMTSGLSKNLQGKIKSITADVESDEGNQKGRQGPKQRRNWRRFYQAVVTVVAVIIVAGVIYATASGATAFVVVG